MKESLVSSTGHDVLVEVLGQVVGATSTNNIYLTPDTILETKINKLRTIKISDKNLLVPEV